MQSTHCATSVTRAVLHFPASSYILFLSLLKSLVQLSNSNKSTHFILIVVKGIMPDYLDITLRWTLPVLYFANVGSGIQKGFRVTILVVDFSLLLNRRIAFELSTFEENMMTYVIDIRSRRLGIRCIATDHEIGPATC